MGAALSVGIGGASIIKNGASPTTALVLLDPVLASTVGCRLGYAIANRKDRRSSTG